MKKLRDALKDMEGQQVDIYTKHYLFDDQHIESSNFIPIIDLGVGFKHKNQNIYIKNEEIETYDVKDDRIIFHGNGFTIMVVKRA